MYSLAHKFNTVRSLSECVELNSIIITLIILMIIIAKALTLDLDPVTIQSSPRPGPYGHTSPGAI